MKHSKEKKRFLKCRKHESRVLDRFRMGHNRATRLETKRKYGWCRFRTYSKAIDIVHESGHLTNFDIKHFRIMNNLNAGFKSTKY